MTKHSTPALRFAGFDGEWVETSLSDIADRFDAARVPVTQKDRVQGPYPYYGANGIQDFINGWTHEGQFVLIAEDGANDLADYPVYLVQGCVWVNNHAHVVQGFPERVSNEFLAVVLKTVDFERVLVGGSRAKLNASQMMSIAFPIPLNREEQDAIGELFADLDALIEQHRDKHANLQQTKTALLQRMFPQDGADEPELRLGGFSGKWEEVRIKKVSDVLVGNPFQSSSFVGDGVRLVRGMNVKRGWLDFDPSLTVFWPSIRGVETFLLAENDILLQMDGALIGKSFAMVSKTDLPALLVQRVARVRAHHNIDPKFLYQWFVKDFFGYIRSVKTETAVPHLSALDIMSFLVKIPPTLEEQCAIGEVFSDLDAFIAAERRYITQLTQAKTALLQRMFV